MVVIAVLVAVMADRVAATSRRYAELYRLASDRLLTAQEDERKRLGRDLHDGVGQTLTAIVLTLDATESSLWAGEQAPSAMAGRASDGFRSSPRSRSKRPARSHTGSDPRASSRRGLSPP